MYEAPRACPLLGGAPIDGSGALRPTLGDAVTGKYGFTPRKLFWGGELGVRDGLVGGCIDSGDDGSLAEPNDGRRCLSVGGDSGLGE